jgi:hypothetical protein
LNSNQSIVRSLLLLPKRNFLTSKALKTVKQYF